MQTPEARKADPIVSRISELAIKGKRALEKAGILPTEYISGFGMKEGYRKKKADPAKKLWRLIANQNNQPKHHKNSNTNYVLKQLLQNKVITI